MRYSLEVVLQLLAIRNNALVVSTTSGMHVDQVLDPLANGTSSLRRNSASLRMAQNFLQVEEESRSVLGAL